LFANGLRNEIGLRWDDVNNQLWGVENGLDNLNRPDLGGDIHNTNPSEEVNLFSVEGGCYGYPYCWSEDILPTFGIGPGTQWATPNFMNVTTDEWCQNTSNVVKPVFNLPAHTAPMDILFYRGTTFPEEYRNSAFISLHGSWNRSPPAGYSVVYLTFNNGLPETCEPFLTYSGNGDAQTGPGWMRPVGLGIIPCVYGECLLIASDNDGTLYAIGYNED